MTEETVVSFYTIWGKWCVSVRPSMLMFEALHAVDNIETGSLVYVFWVSNLPLVIVLGFLVFSEYLERQNFKTIYSCLVLHWWSAEFWVAACLIVHSRNIEHLSCVRWTKSYTGLLWASVEYSKKVTHIQKLNVQFQSVINI